MKKKPLAVIPDNLSEMSPHEAWNLALNTIAPIAEWNSFWNDGQETGEDIYHLIIEIKEKRNARKRFRYRNSPRRLFSR